ncbi:MAG TPA: hypothetical protein DC058_09290 [Planctomycetaceae bacterium]|nr:hypothetical protein [Planctomycetaceae bacterium]
MRECVLVSVGVRNPEYGTGAGSSLPAVVSFGITVFSCLFGNLRRVYVTGFPGRPGGVGFYSAYRSGDLGCLF